MLRSPRGRRIVGPMAWIESNQEERFSPLMRAQGSNPAVRAAHVKLYAEAMERSSSLARVEREAIAVRVSELNGSAY